MDMGIRGRRALVNGASAGMGLAAADMLAAEGVHLVMSARGAPRLEAAASELRKKYGVDVIAVAADHSTVEGRARILEICPDPDILVGTCSPPPMTPDHTAITPAAWQAALDTGLMGPVQIIEAVLPAMVKRRWGRIVNIASIAAKYPLELRILSGGPRAALVNYSVAVARRVAADNVTLNTVLPGMFHTAFVHDQFTENARRNGTHLRPGSGEVHRGLPDPRETLRRSARCGIPGDLAVQRARGLHHRTEHRGRWRHHALHVLIP